MKPNRSIPLILVAAIGLLAGCNTPTKTAETEKKPVAAKQQQEYVQVNSVGSWIPRKVKKKADLIGDTTQVLEGQALDKINAAGRTRTTKEGQLAHGGDVPFK